MQLQKAQRNKAKIKIGLQGASGSGKTMSALLLGYGLCNSWDKIAVIDSENNSAHLYSHLGGYNVIGISAPFNPEKYIEALTLAVKAGMEVVIIDSISHEWEGVGGIIDLHGSMAGNSFTNWNKITPKHNAFVNAILQSPVHVLATIRTKQDYVLVEKNGKQVPEKVGLKGITRDGMDYELTIVFDLDIKHNAVVSKDRTGIFSNEAEFKITADVGRRILEWCNTGESLDIPSNRNSQSEGKDLQEKISSTKTVEELLSLYKIQSPAIQKQFSAMFTKKRTELTVVAPNETKHISHYLKPTTNGNIGNTTH
jgi:hypothetical protein